MGNLTRLRLNWAAKAIVKAAGKIFAPTLQGRSLDEKDMKALATIAAAFGALLGASRGNGDDSLMIALCHTAGFGVHKESDNSLTQMMRVAWKAWREFIAEHESYFEGGAGRLTINPECEAADQMIGWLSDFSDPEHPFIVSRSSDAPVFAGADVTLRDEGGLFDCSAIAEAKIAAAFLADSMGLPMFSGFGLAPEANMGNGIAQWKGGAGLKVFLKGQLFCTIAFATSGGTEDHDLECTKHVIEAIREFFLGLEDEGFSVSDPFTELENYLATREAPEPLA